MTEKNFIPRTPSEINKDLRPLVEKMNDYSEGKTRPGSEKRAFHIQHLQQELKSAMKFHIKLVPEPGKLTLIKQFP